MGDRSSEACTLTPFSYQESPRSDLSGMCPVCTLYQSSPTPLRARVWSVKSLEFNDMRGPCGFSPEASAPAFHRRKRFAFPELAGSEEILRSAATEWRYVSGRSSAGSQRARVLGLKLLFRRYSFSAAALYLLITSTDISLCSPHPHLLQVVRTS